MAKEAESAGSDKAELKKWLNRADSKPVHMAFAFGKDGKAVLKLDGMKQGRSLEKSIKDGVPDGKNHRFGTVEIDPANPDVVRFLVNKSVGGAARKLSIALKGTGFKKVQIVMDDGSVDEAGDEDEDEDEGGDASAGATDSDVDAPAGADASSDDNAWEEPPRLDPSATGDDGVQAGADASDATPQPDPGVDAAAGDDGSSGEPEYTEPEFTQGDPAAPAAGAAPDAAALTQQLTALVKQMMGAIKKDPTQKAVLAELATDAQASLKRGDLESAAAGLEILRQAIADAMGQDPSAGPAPGGDPASNGQAGSTTTSPTPGNPAAANGASNGAAGGPAAGASAQKFQKSRVAWTATRAKIDADLKKLSKAIVDATDGEDMGDDIEGQFMSSVEPVLDELDGDLAEMLGGAASTTDPAELQTMLGDLRKEVASHTQFVTGNKIIADLDNNPFLPLTIGKTLTATLAAISAILR